MMWVTTDTIAGYKVQQTLGPVRGSSVRAKWIGADIIAGLRNIFGGEITEYSKLLEETREQAISRMLADAEKMKANAIISDGESEAIFGYFFNCYFDYSLFSFRKSML